ncbi:ubiquitin-like protein [Armillaria solidipes]|uniref:Ubiquitin-like protein n=1 Tax=Armillaria solidipes TaxID=1076256 RepID=A0A2H3B9X3_9AGAR|nr:ubiquitin-like protein [Armillaria solidipes]
MSTVASSSQLSPPPKFETDDDELVSNSDSITLKVLASTGHEKTFKLKSSTSLRKLFHVYAQTTGKDIDTLKFIYEGQRLNPHYTPKMYSMENEDTIDVMLEQIGGMARK